MDKRKQTKKAKKAYNRVQRKKQLAAQSQRRFDIQAALIEADFAISRAIDSAGLDPISTLVEDACTADTQDALLDENNPELTPKQVD